MRVLFNILAPLVVAIVGYCTYFHNYSEPNNFFWDENYHVVAAQKYLNHIFFMEPHPPLGKMLIALGEDLLQANQNNSELIGMDYSKNSPKDLSLRGYRLFPALFGWLAALLVYAAFLEITKDSIRSSLLSSLYIFDNAIIVHSRGAMLDSTQLFFILAMLYLFLRIRAKQQSMLTAVLMGIFFGAALCTKANALLFAPLVLLPLYYLESLKCRINYLGTVALSSIVIMIAVWTFAFSLATNVNSKLQRDGWYEASLPLKERLKSGDRTLKTLTLFVTDSLKFSEHYHSRVPKLNYCKSDENGSYPLLWPLGARSINYRWKRDGAVASYLYLQSNPFGWFCALLSISASLALLICTFLRERTKQMRNEDLLWILTGSYLLYMGACLAVDRVFYLYHYFPPLVLCFFLGVVLLEGLAVTSTRRTSISVLIALGCFGSFLVYKPFTYFEPLTPSQVSTRSLLRLWDLVAVDRDKINPIARPSEAKDKHGETSGDWFLELSGVRSTIVTQSWGAPRNGSTVDGNPLTFGDRKFSSGFGVHASSRIEFPIAKHFRRFSALIAIPEEIEANTNAAVRFQVIGDGSLLWESPVVVAGSAPTPVDVDVSGKSILALSVLPAGKGIDNNHATWLEPRLTK